MFYLDIKMWRPQQHAETPLGVPCAQDNLDQKNGTVSWVTSFDVFILRLGERRAPISVCLPNSFGVGLNYARGFRVTSEPEWPFTDDQPWIWGEEATRLYKHYCPLASRRVHCGESQDAPVVGTERIRGTPRSAEVGGAAPSYGSGQHSSNSRACCFSRETAHGVQALDTCICFSKLCLFSTCRMELSVEYLLHNIKK